MIVDKLLLGGGGEQWSEMWLLAVMKMVVDCCYRSGSCRYIMMMVVDDGSNDYWRCTWHLTIIDGAALKWKCIDGRHCSEPVMFFAALRNCLQRSVLSLILGEPLGRSTVYIVGSYCSSWSVLLDVRCTNFHWWHRCIKAVAFWDLRPVNPSLFCCVNNGTNR